MRRLLKGRHQFFDARLIPGSGAVFIVNHNAIPMRMSSIYGVTHLPVSRSFLLPLYTDRHDLPTSVIAEWGVYRSRRCTRTRYWPTDSANLRVTWRFVTVGGLLFVVREHNRPLIVTLNDNLLRHPRVRIRCLLRCLLTNRNKFPFPVRNGF